VRYWRHVIEVAPGVFTPGTDRPAGPAVRGGLRERFANGRHAVELAAGTASPGARALPGGSPRSTIAAKLGMGCLPESLSGKTVLDVGAWDGFYSFEAERRGARRVLATDWYVWQQPHFGKEGFLTARRLLGSRVEDRDVDVPDVSAETVGVFDVVLFLGVLYHLSDPEAALERMAAVTGELCVVETELIRIAGLDELSLMRFLPDSKLGDDPTNHWAPNVRCVERMCLRAGFRRVELVRPPRFPWPRSLALEALLLRPSAGAWRNLRQTLRAPVARSRGTFYAYK
jgi:tRNA (mo5U34)-methyltransferase